MMFAVILLFLASMQSVHACATARKFPIPLSSTAVSPETEKSLPESAEYSSDTHEVSRKVSRIVKRQAGRANIVACDNYLLERIMNQVVGPLTSHTNMRLGDVAQRLQQSVQRATGRSYEVFLGRGEMTFLSYQTNSAVSCRLRIGEFYTMVYETPIQYNINNVQQEQILSNIDFGESLGGSGYPGQAPFPHRIYSSLNDLFSERQCFSGDLVVETVDGPKRMSELKTGDEVLSVDEEMGMITFSPIIMFLHRDVEQLAEFIVITTANGNSVKLTREHLIYVFDCHDIKALRPVRAKEVSTSHCLLTTNSSPTTLDIDRVSNVSKVYERGIFSPLTSTGDIMVNGVLSSCHSSLAFKTLQQSLFNAYRFMYRSLSFILPAEGPLPIGLTTLVSALDLFIPEKATLN